MCVCVCVYYIYKLSFRFFFLQIIAGLADEDEAAAVEVLFRAMGYPISQIAENAGVDGSIVLEKVRQRIPHRRTIIVV